MNLQYYKKWKKSTVNNIEETKKFISLAKKDLQNKEINLQQYNKFVNKLSYRLDELIKKRNILTNIIKKIKNERKKKQ